MATEVGSIVYKLDLDTGNFDSKSRQASQSFSDLAKNAALIGLGAKSFQLLRDGILGTVSVASSFQSAFAGVTKTTDGLDNGLGKLTGAGQKLRAELINITRQAPIAFEEIAKIAELGGQLGVPKEALADFSKSIADIAVSSNLTSEVAATAFAQIGNVLQITGGDLDDFASRFGSAIIDLGNNFATTEADITNFAQRIAGAGKIVGLSAADIAGISTAFTSVGVEAEAGGTAVQKVLLELNDAVVNGGDNLKTFAKTTGLSVSEFKKQFGQDASGVFEKFVLGLSKQGKNAQKTLADLGLEDQRLIRSFLSVSQSGDLITRTLDTANEAYKKNTALTAEAQRRYATFDSRIQILKNNFLALVDTVGKLFLPILSAAADLIGKFLQEVNKGNPIFVAIAAAVGTFAIIVAGAFIAIAVSAAAALVPVGALATVIGILTSPITLVVVAIVALGAALVAAYKKSETFRNIVNGVFNGIKTVVGAVVEFIKSNWELVLLAIAPIGVPILIAIKAFQFLQANAGKAIEFIKKGLELLRPVFDIISNAFSTAGKNIVAAFNLISKTISPAIQAIQTALAPLFAKFQEFLTLMQGPLLNVLKILGVTILAVVVAPLVALGSVILVTTLVFAKLIQFGSFLISKIVQIGVNIVNLATQFILFATRILTTITNFVNRIITLFNTMYLRAVAIVSAMVNRVVAFVSNMVARIISFVGNMVGRIVSFFSSLFVRIGGIVQSGINRIAGLFSGIAGRIRGAIGNLFGVGSQLIDGLVNGIRSGFGRIGSVIQELANKIPGPIKKILGIRSPSRVFAGIGENIIEGLINGIESQSVSLISMVDAIKDIINSRIESQIGVKADIGANDISSTIGGGSSGSNSTFSTTNNNKQVIVTVLPIDGIELTQDQLEQWAQRALSALGQTNRKVNSLLS